MPNGADEETTQDRVADAELLYRRVPRNTEQTRHYDISDGKLRVLAQTFSERPIPNGEPFAGEYRLSVDRAKLRGFDPTLTRQGVAGRNPEDFGVVCMPAGEVRAISGVKDIIPDPIVNAPELSDNPAHALICVAYIPESKTASKNKLKEVIAELAAAANRRPWAIDPPDETI